MQRNVGILQREVSLAPGPGTRLRWSWRVDALPSALREDTALTHDCVSIAVEFCDGRDIIYTWSRRLRADHAARMGPPLARIARGWPIAVGLFQRLEGRCWFADVERVQGERTVRVL